jgi:rhodanese-related sulfurtransferase
MTQLRLIDLMANTEDAIKTAKEKMPDVTPTPPDLHAQASAHELKSRLNWGEPALTILDVRDRSAFHDYCIRGAMSMPMDTLADVAKASLEPKRDIYVYGANDQETAEAANILRQAGFHRVAELKGGLAAWKEIGGPVDGSESSKEPLTAGAYNVASRLKEFSEEKAHEKQQDKALS